MDISARATVPRREHWEVWLPCTLGRRNYVETLIRAPLDKHWEHTQDCALRIRHYRAARVEAFGSG
ncbi:hypothetical protein GCM10011359_19370 [Nesterenkonia alkaliphila]|nr:hypothetical protein GCM10011359_19370 [Nesterenkonia alkaliphila]